MTEDGPATADLSALGQGGALSPQRCLIHHGVPLSLVETIGLLPSAELRLCCEIEASQPP